MGFVCAEQLTLLPTSFPFQWEPAASMVEGGRCSGSLGPYLLTCVVWGMLYVLSFELCSLNTPSNEKISSSEANTWVGQSPLSPCHAHHLPAMPTITVAPPQGSC